MESKSGSDYSVVIGGANLDIAGFSAKSLIRRDSNPGAIRISPGGVGRNIAENMARLGSQTRLISVVGNDAFGQRILEESARAGVDVSMVRKVNDLPTSVYLSILDAEGEMDVAVSDMQIMSTLNIDFLKQHHETISRASAIVIETNLDKRVIDYLVDTYPERMFVDTVSTTKAEKLTDVLGSLYAISANRKEAALLTELPIGSIAEAQKAVDCLLDKGVKLVIVSLSNEGVVYGNSDHRGHFRLINVNSANTTGAGDAFLATVVSAMLAQVGLDQAVKFASVAAYLTLNAENTISTEISWETIEKTLEELNR